MPHQARFGDMVSSTVEGSTAEGLVCTDDSYSNADSFVGEIVFLLSLVRDLTCETTVYTVQQYRSMQHTTRATMAPGPTATKQGRDVHPYDLTVVLPLAQQQQQQRYDG